MKKLVWLIIIVAIVVVAAGMLGGDGTRSDLAGQTIKLGVVTPLSGEAAAFGEEVQNVVSYRIDQINEAAGEDGVRFEAVFEDGKCAGGDSVNAFQKLVDVDGVSVIIGGTCSSETLGMAPLASEREILLFSPHSSNPNIEDAGPFVFSLSYSDSKVAEDLAQAVSAHKRVAIITEQNDYNIGIRDGVLAALESVEGLEIVANEAFPKGDANFRSVLEKIRAAAPDALILNPNVGTTAETLLRQLAEVQSWGDYTIYTQFAYLPESAREAVGDFAEGMVIIDVPSVNDPAFIAIRDEIVEATAPVDDIGSYYTASTLDVVDLVTSLIAKHGTDPMVLREELATGSFKGYIGDIRFNGNNFVEFNLSGTYIVENGEAVLQ